MTLDFGKNVLDKANDRNDDWGKKVKAIVVGVQCLVAEEARYHRSCSAKFVCFFREKAALKSIR